MCARSLLQTIRSSYQPKLPKVLKNITEVSIESNEQKIISNSSVLHLFPHLLNLPTLLIKKGIKQNHHPLRVGVVLSGGQAPGGHNVIAGLFDALKTLNEGSVLFGFLDGPNGIVINNYVEITETLLAAYRNQGGFDIIGSGRTKIESPEQFKAAEVAVRFLNLDGVVIIGGDDSNTNAALLAEYFAANDCKTAVVGVPKTIDGDLKNKDIEISFGFDTASKTYSDTIGNIMRDTLSAKKYYYFIKLMGRSASHITLECALQTHPNFTLIGEEIAAEGKTLNNIVMEICDLICTRAEKGKDYGVILIPEGAIEFIAEFKTLINELNSLLSLDKPHAEKIKEMARNEDKVAYIAKLLSSSSKKCFDRIPAEIQAQLLLGRDPHGNVQVSKIEIERLFIEMVKSELKMRKKAGKYCGKFSAQPLFCGYEGRSCLPSNFDCQYCYALGYVAAALINAEASGYMCCIKNLSGAVDQWEAKGIPLTSMMGIEIRHGEEKPVITKALVNLEGKPFSTFKRSREKWALEDDYISPGPIQFFGPAELTENITTTLFLEGVDA